MVALVVTPNIPASPSLITRPNMILTKLCNLGLEPRKDAHPCDCYENRAREGSHHACVTQWLPYSHVSE